MFGFGEYSEQGRPWFYLGRVPMYSATLLVAIFVVSMVVMTILAAAEAAGVLNALPLIQSSVFHGEVWRLVTWPLVNFPSIWFALSMLMLYWFGRTVEQMLGRVGLLKFVGWLAAALVVVTLLLPGAVLAGSRDLGFGVFLAFAIIHPSAMMLFGMTAKWVAIILVAISALSSLAAQDWAGLVQLATICAASAVILRMMGAAHSLPWLNLPRISLKTHSSGKTRPSPRALSEPRGTLTTQSEIDRLLDKVAEKGLHSLTDAERRLLAEKSEHLRRQQ